MTAINRRQMLGQSIQAMGLLMLRSMASGIPPGILLHPRKLLALEPVRQATDFAPQYLVIGTSDDGEPMNANVPGMYADARIIHSADPAMAATTINLGGVSAPAAKPWSTLAASTLNRTTFFHHATESFQHGTMQNVAALQGRMRRGTMLISEISEALAPQLGTIQAAPVCMVNGQNEIITVDGRPQPSYRITDLQAVLSTPAVLSSLGKLVELRDRDLAKVYALAKAEGTPAQQAMVDRWALSQSQARQIPAATVTGLSALKSNDFSARLTAALLLIQAKISPVINVHIDFGADNHEDKDLTRETTAHLATLAALKAFFANVDAAGLTDQITFATMHVFGRTNTNNHSAHTPRMGRDHNGLHACNIMTGKNIRGGLVGGAIFDADSNDFSSLPIDSSSGQGVAGGNIGIRDSLTAYGATLATAVGAATPGLLEKIAGDAPVVKSALI